MTPEDRFDAPVDGNAHPDSVALVDRRRLLRSAVGLSALTVGGGMLGVAEAAARSGVVVNPVSSFAIAVLPDTQFYARYATTDEGQQFQSHYGSTPFAAQTG